MKRRIVPGGILALSFAVVLLGATASTASAERALGAWVCGLQPTPPTTIDEVNVDCLDQSGSFDFGDRQVGTTSAAPQRFALGVYCISACNDTLNPRIGVSGDYAQTNDCPPTLSATQRHQLQGCQISVTFTPTGTGPRHGTLSTGPGGPAVALTGNGVTTPTPSPDLQLSGPKKQNPPAEKICVEYQWKCGVRVKVSCGADACTARAEGKLTKVKNDKLEPSERVDLRPLFHGGTLGLGLELAKEAQRREVREALDNGKNVQAKVTVRATDAAGNVAVEKRTIKLVK